jgi:hypothetical protein
MVVLLPPARAGKRRTVHPPYYAAFSNLRAALAKSRHPERGIIRKSAWYVAANWVRLGLTTGRGHNAPTKKPRVAVKEILGYPLTRRFREILSGVG